MTEKHLEEDTVEAGCEEWRDIKGYEGFYQVSSFGRIRSLDHVFYQKHYSGIMAKHISKGRIMRPHKRRNGYWGIGLTDKNGKQTGHLIHRLVAEHFLEKPEGKDCVNHLDSNPLNNHVNNLEWCTQSENIQYAYDQGRKTPPHERKVAQYDFDGNLVKVWKSLTAPMKELGIQSANIGKVCRGKRNHTGGFKWAYIE